MKVLIKKGSRVFCCLLVLLVLCLALPSEAKAAKELDIKMGKVNLYTYSRIKEISQLTEMTDWTDIVICWHKDDEVSKPLYFTHEPSKSRGWGTSSWWYGTDYIWGEYGETMREDVFTCQEKYGHFQAKFITGEYDIHHKTGSSNSPKLYVRAKHNDTWYYLHGELGGAGTGGMTTLAPDPEKHGKDSMLTFQIQKNEKSDYYNYIRILEDRYWAASDIFYHLDIEGKEIRTRHSGMGDTHDYEEHFMVYSVETRTYDVYVDDIDVVDGSTMRVDDKVMLADGDTITVKDGGTLAINAELYLNGKIVIEEGGTVILNPGARVMPMYNKAQDAGSIDVAGGNLIILEDARLFSDCGKSTINVSRGGSIINKGLIVANVLNLTDHARLLNDDNGIITMGFTGMWERAFLPTLDVKGSLEKVKNASLSSSKLYLSGSSQFINRGVIDNGVKKMITVDKVEAVRTGSSICRHEGDGYMTGWFWQRTQVAYGVGILEPWPSGWPSLNN
ncbi:MAG: hypothetical protein Q4B50_05995 [Bacillota bacterium]|nr:hypothetical protein [Bacillota bacterium]